jgi:transposase
MPLGRPKAPLSIPEQHRAELLRWIKLPKTSNALAQRARILLRCADGIPNSAVAREFRVTNDTVGKWRSRYLQRGLAGLLDEPRCGAPRQISDDQVEAVVNATLESMPTDATHWSTRSMAARSGLSYASVRRIWHAFGLLDRPAPLPAPQLFSSCLLIVASATTRLPRVRSMFMRECLELLGCYGRNRP